MNSKIILIQFLAFFLLGILPINLNGGSIPINTVKAAPVNDMEAVLIQHSLDSTKTKYQQQFELVKKTFKNYELKYKFTED